MGWTPLSNHGKVLVCVASDPGVRVSQIADIVGVKERAVQRILAQLRDDGVVASRREGRRNRYSVNRRRRMRWGPDRDVQVGRLIDAVDV